MKISIINQKGGTGKTTTAVNLSYALAQAGKKTLLIDMDPQAHSCAIYMQKPGNNRPTITNVLTERRFDINEAIQPAFIPEGHMENLFFIASDIHLEKAERDIYNEVHREKILHNQLKKVEHDFQFILIDCPPRLNQLTINSIYTSDLLLVPVVMDRYALDGVSDLFDTIEEVREGDIGNYLILKNAYDKRESRSNIIAETVLNNLADNTCKTTIRRTSKIKQAQQHNQPIFTFDKKSPVCDDYVSLSKELITYHEGDNT